MPRLPGSDIVKRGVADLEHGVESIDALLVSIGAPRLRLAGIHIPANTLEKPELRLYRTLANKYGDAAHSRYNALIARLVSYERALCVS